jgi:DNA adenine methylase
MCRSASMAILTTAATFPHMGTPTRTPCLTAAHFEQVAVEPDDFIYADPPYDGDEGAFTGYAGIPFDWQDQVALTRWLARHPGPVVASNAATSRIVEFYRDLGFALSERQVASTRKRTDAGQSPKCLQSRI